MFQVCHSFLLLRLRSQLLRATILMVLEKEIMGLQDKNIYKTLHHIY